MVAEAKRGSWPQDENLWQIQCFGELDLSPATPSELTQHLLLRYVPETGRTPPAQLTKIVYAGSGLIPSLNIGQRWRNQRLVGQASFAEFDDEVDFGDEHWHFADGMTTFGNNRYLIPPTVYPLAPFIRIPLLAITYKGIPEGLLIPCSEITRAWYFRSTALVHRFTEAPLDEEGLDRFCRLDYPGTATDGNWLIEGRTGFSDSDLPFIAMLRCDPLALRRAKMLMDSLVEAKERGAPNYIRSKPPLDGRWRLAAQGQWFESGNARRFLVHRITSAPFPRNPGYLHGDLENSNNSIDLGHKELKESKWKKKPTRHATDKDSVANFHEPQVDAGEIYEFGALPMLYNMPVFRRLPPREQTTRSVAREEESLLEEGDASTGQGNYTDGNPIPMKVKDDQPIRRALVPADFNTLLKVGVALNKLTGISCRPVSRSRYIAGTYETPCSLFQVKGRRKRQWVEVGLRPRQFMVLDILAANKHIYAIEIERRPPPRAPGKGEAFALGLLTSLDGRELGLGQFEEIMAAVARNRGVWPLVHPGIDIQKADHRSKGIDGFAMLVATKIYGWVPEIKPEKPAKRRTRQTAARYSATTSC